MIHDSKPSIDFHDKKKLLLFVVSSKLAVKILFSSKVGIALLKSNTFSILSTDGENVSDTKKDERETNRNS